MLHFLYHRKNRKNIIPAEEIEKITLVNPHGSGEDIETLMMDPVTNQIYLLTKNHNKSQDALAYIYKVSLYYNDEQYLVDNKLI